MQAQMWQLLMEANSRELEAVVLSPYEEQHLTHKVISLDSETSSPLKCLEDAVYANDFLLTDYRHTMMLYDCGHALPLPLCDDDSMLAALYREAYPGDGGSPSTMLISRLPEQNVALCSEIPTDIHRFLTRTFPGIAVEHPLVPLCRYFRARYALRPRGKTLVNLRGKRLDIITLGAAAPLTVASYHVEAVMDALYYILAAREALQLPDTDEIMVAGDRHLRAEITPLLRRYVRYVMPAIYPSAMIRAGKVSLSAPFGLIVAPLTWQHVLHQPKTTQHQ